MNNLLEFGGKGQIIATALCDFSINDYEYKTGDIVFDFNDVNVSFLYGHTTSQGNNSRTQLFYEEFYLDSLSVDVVPLDKNFRIFCDNKLEKISVYEKESLVSVGKHIFLKQLAKEDSVRIKEVENFEIQNTSEFTIIRSEEFVDDTIYDVYYSKEIISKSIVLDNQEIDIPYLKLQVKFMGNDNKETSENYIIVPKAAMRFTPVFNLQNNSVSHVRLSAKIIEDKESKPILSVI